MLTLETESNERFVIFSVAPNRYGEVSQLVNTLPHKWLIGQFKGQTELSALLPAEVFGEHISFLMEGQDTYLDLEPVKRFGERKAFLVSRERQESHYLGMFRQVASVKPDEDFTFDPSTGFYFATSEEGTGN
jgi:hypothetical protein